MGWDFEFDSVSFWNLIWNFEFDSLSLGWDFGISSLIVFLYSGISIFPQAKLTPSWGRSGVTRIALTQRRAKLTPLWGRSGVTRKRNVTEIGCRRRPGDEFFTS